MRDGDVGVACMSMSAARVLLVRLTRHEEPPLCRNHLPGSAGEWRGDRYYPPLPDTRSLW